MLGNLLGNACKWAKSRIALQAFRSGSVLVLRMDDDGPGITPALRKAALERGVRIGESPGGSGLGLAIMSELAGVYGGSISLDDSQSGGLRVQLSLPAA
jgi:signal transduction histidine kinase